MLKKIVIFSLMGVGLLLHGEEVKLANMDFSEGLKNWVNAKLIQLPPEKLGFGIEQVDGKNVLAIVGPAADSKRGYKTINRHIPKTEQEIRFQTVRLSGEIKVVKLSGTFNFMVREAGPKGTLRYRKTVINKWEKPGDWKKISCSFVAGPPTKFIQIYLQSGFLAPGDKVYLRNLKLDLTPYKRR